MAEGAAVAAAEAAAWVASAVKAWGAYAAFALAVISTAVTAINASKRSSSNSAEAAQRRGIQTNTVDTQVPLRVVYGHHRVGINIDDMALAGSDNKYLYLIGAFCEGEINKVVQVSGVDQIFLDNKLWNTFGGKVSYEIFTGGASQAICSTYSGLKPAWDSALPYTAYIYLRLEYDQDTWQSRPEVVLEIEGLKIYNPDTGVTEYSNNPALCVRDFMTRSARRGGMGISASRIDDDSVISAAAYCTAKGWTCDLVLQDGDASAIDHLQSILTTFRGSVIRSGSKFKLVYADLDYETSVMDITEDDIIENSGKSSLSITQPSIFDTPNAVKMKYFNAENAYAADELVFSDATAIVADGDYREKEISVPGIASTANVQKMANYFLERLRVNKTASILSGTRCMALEPQDLITLTHSRPGWSSKIMRVTQPSISQNGEVGLALIEEDEDFYDDTYNLETHSWDDTNLPSPQATVLSVINVTHTEEVYNYRNRSFTRWKINFDAPAKADYPWFDHADIWIKIGTGDWKYQTTATTDFVLDPVEEGQTYYCTIVAVSIWGTKQAFAEGYQISTVIAGKTAVPSNITGFTALAHGDAISLFADELDESDIAGYEIRLGAAWEGGILIGFNETPNIRINGVRPSTVGVPHTFWICARDNAGYYSATPASAQVTVYYPANYVDKNTWSWDFDAIGTFTNTEHETYDGSDALKCSHTGNVLTGTWLSPEYDLGSSKTVRIWGDFITAFESTGGTWDSLFPSTTLWSDKLSTTTRWYELLSPAYAGIISAKLLWGTTSGALTESTDKLEILAPEITARYVQVEITITDPEAAANLHLKTLSMTAAYWS